MRLVCHGVRQSGGVKRSEEGCSGVQLSGGGREKCAGGCGGCGEVRRGALGRCEGEAGEWWRVDWRRLEIEDVAGQLSFGGSPAVRRGEKRRYMRIFLVFFVGHCRLAENGLDAVGCGRYGGVQRGLGSGVCVLRMLKRALTTAPSPLASSEFEHPDGLHAHGKRTASLVKAIKEERRHAITKDEELPIIEGGEVFNCIPQLTQTPSHAPHTVQPSYPYPRPLNTPSFDDPASTWRLPVPPAPVSLQCNCALREPPLQLNRNPHPIPHTFHAHLAPSQRNGTRTLSRSSQLNHAHLYAVTPPASSQCNHVNAMCTPLAPSQLNGVQRDHPSVPAYKRERREIRQLQGLLSQ
ncbi:hypothetical protein F5887DRAFT_916877 [Amanita rubescens]|nr:hypothetical protein F5887DRAFT_916877 [Amanita rubescens]